MDKCVVRQAIKEVQTGKIIGYELLFQGGSSSFYNEPETSAANTIAGFLMNNSNKIFRDKPMFITFTPSLLFRNTPKMFQKDNVIIQIDDSLIVHPLSLPIIKKYCAEGYRFSINDFQFSPKYFSMLEFASYIRINLKGKNAQTSQKEKNSLENIVKMAQGFAKKCIATGVDTDGEYELAKALGVDFLEGNYVASTLMTKAEKIDYMQGNFFQLVISVSKDEPEMDEVEMIVSRDAGLTYALLKLVNSAYFALRRRTASIRQALMTLGIGQLRQWVYMLSFQGDIPGDSEEILKISFLRANFASALSERIKGCPISKSDAYMMGMFSTLEYLVNAPIEELLEEIPIAEEIKVALIRGEGIAGSLLSMMFSYEKADWKTTKELAEGLDIKTNLLAQIYVNCVEEVNEIWEGLTTEFARAGDSTVYQEADGREHLEDILT